MSSGLIRFSGLAAVLGGALWIIGAVNHASKPRGCIAEECAFRQMRESGALDGILTLLSLLLFAVAVTGLVILARSAGRFGKTGKTGVVLAAAGVALLVIVSLIQSVFFGGDFPLMPYFVIPSLLAMVAGLVLLGVAILRSRVLPRWTAALLIIGALAMLGVNEQTSRVLLTIPLGVAWVAVGYVLWTGRQLAAEHAARVR